ncbi:LPXTG-motif cell wall anchor domain protein [Pseudarthrobacter chlorophenolicus A6]|uniref:LPXTG-motif cell wall anchor domain protein n=1 Tax=Pseudarthrobacter chlorophenolicus (strain ATCC 700700 / DSM 12829 / CIP 107037 / JCM 12360 / KCTC 9906 / NCIMB 13794 / A6) TaxID=452863 RepID=B8HEG7_PSECP|nr:LPXTG cell wall anchor domain-containing protein [Pseudarthrobacter chlorophenolicus]ACL40912.1 LPXTG-motif cell wall anchor domain protein [Pseudarthrobacter chlorophenolicus A6]SDQ73019.1 LPXTG-motif cell wall anchor domain-containing protein [Pseudarthrobacter chlorophenolicus]
MKKTLATLALAGSIALVGAAPSMATTYPALPPQAAVSDGSVAPGETFTFTGQGFLAGETVTITVTLVTGGATNAGGTAVSAKIPVFQAPQTLTATADAQGKISVPLALNEAGTYSITATGNTSGVTVGPVTVTVAASLANTGGAPLANTGAGAGLANTGADSGLVLWTLVGAGALAAGATSVVVVRRRAKAEAAA